jgi:hypothetical protein
LRGCWAAGLPVRRFAGLPVCRFAGLPVCRFAGLPVCRFAGLPVCRFAGLPELRPRQLASAAHHAAAGVLSRPYRRFFALFRTPSTIEVLK